MFGMPATVRAFVAVPPADLRKGYDGLARIARDAIGEDPLSGHLFVFASRRRDRIKVLYRDRDGYAIRMKRLERGSFRWPAPAPDHVERTAPELAAALGGIDLKATGERPRFAPAASRRISTDCTDAASRVTVFERMARDDATLPDDLGTAHRQIREQAEALRQRGRPIARLRHRLEQLLRARYGRKGEAVDPDQLLLFAHDVLARPGPMSPAPQPAEPVATKPESAGRGRKPLPASLPRERIVHDVAPEGRACPECGGERRKIGEEARERLEYVPASLIALDMSGRNMRARRARRTS